MILVNCREKIFGFGVSSLHYIYISKVSSKQEGCNKNITYHKLPKNKVENYIKMRWNPNNSATSFRKILIASKDLQVWKYKTYSWKQEDVNIHGEIKAFRTHADGIATSWTSKVFTDPEWQRRWIMIEKIGLDSVTYTNIYE